MGDKYIKTVEKRFLSYIFKDKKYISMTIGKIRKEHLPNYWPIYALSKAYFCKYKDIITDEIINMQFMKRGLSKELMIEYKSLIPELRVMTVNGEGEFNAIIDQLFEYCERDGLFQLAEQIVNTNPKLCDLEKLNSLKLDIKKIFADKCESNSSIKDEGSILKKPEDRLQKYLDIEKNPEKIKSIPSGYRAIDEENGGFRPGELIYVIGRKGDGKSTLLLNFAYHAWHTGHNVIIFSLEISKDDYERRFDSRACGISSNGLKRGKLSPGEKELYIKYIDCLKNGKSLDNKKVGIVYIVDLPPGCNTSQVETEIDRIESLEGIKFDVAITDYAGIMDSNTPQTEKRHQQGAIALEQKTMARKRDIIVISAAQKSRAGVGQKESNSAFVAESDQVADHLDWGIDIQSTSDDFGIMQSFKTRDAAPFKFEFKKKYSCMLIGDADPESVERENGWAGM